MFERLYSRVWNKHSPWKILQKINKHRAMLIPDSRVLIKKLSFMNKVKEVTVNMIYNLLIQALVHCKCSCHENYGDWELRDL